MVNTRCRYLVCACCRGCVYVCRRMIGRCSSAGVGSMRAVCGRRGFVSRCSMGCRSFVVCCRFHIGSLLRCIGTCRLVSRCSMGRWCFVVCCRFHISGLLR